MIHENYEKVIDLLSPKLKEIRHIQILKTIMRPNYISIGNKLFLVHQGNITLSDKNTHVVLQKGELLFVPEAYQTSMTYGSGKSIPLDKETFIKDQDKYVKFLQPATKIFKEEAFSCITFDVKVHNSIDFFKFMDISAFKIEQSPSIYKLCQSILNEDNKQEVGQNAMFQAYILELSIMLIRHIIDQRLFIEQMVLKGGLLTDPSLVALYGYIANNLSENLSNETLAEKLGLSRDYIGQYFKKLTGFNLQDCVEIMRLTKAIELLKTTPMKIQDVSKACGYKDISYFCKKFKNLWGITAKKIRNQHIAT